MRVDVVLRFEEHCGFAIMKVAVLLSDRFGQTQLHKPYIFWTRSIRSMLHPNKPIR
jgi:hypothetical protein